MTRVAARRAAAPPTTRGLFASSPSLSFGAVAAALVSQHVFGMQPCPWCVLQRLIFLGDRRLRAARPGLARRRRRRVAGTFAPAARRRRPRRRALAALRRRKSASCNLTLADRIVSATRLDQLLPERLRGARELRRRRASACSACRMRLVGDRLRRLRDRADRASCAPAPEAGARPTHVFDQTPSQAPADIGAAVDGALSPRIAPRAGDPDPPARRLRYRRGGAARRVPRRPRAMAARRHPGESAPWLVSTGRFKAIDGIRGAARFDAARRRRRRGDRGDPDGQRATNPTRSRTTGCA